MELKDFIKTALMDVVEAVKEAQDSVKDVATIAPYTAGNKLMYIKTPEGYANISNIDFDVAVTTETKENVEGGLKGGIQVAGILSFGAGGKEEIVEKSQNISRIKFSIPVVLPHTAAPNEEIERFVGGKKTTMIRSSIHDNQGE